MSLISLKNRNLLLFCFILMLIPEFAIAAAQDGTASQSLDLFKTGAFSFYNNITPGAIKLLWSLTAASFAYLTFRNLVESQPFEKTLSLLVRLCFYPAVYSLFIHKGIEWLPKFIDVATYFGQAGTGQTRSLNPDAIFRMGIDLQNAMVVGFNDTAGTGLGAAISNIVPSILLTVVCVLVIVAFGFMAGMIYWITAEAYILIAIAPILFALGAGHWTKDIGQKPFNSMIGVTVKLIILYMIVSIAISAIPSWGVLASQWALDNWGPLWTIAWQASLFAFLSFKIPTIAQNALTGSTSLSPGEALQMAAQAGAAAVGAGMVAAGLTGKGVDAGLDALSKGTSELPNAGKSWGEAFNPNANSLRPIISDIDTQQASKNVPDPTGPSPSSDRPTSTPESDNKQIQANASTTAQSTSAASTTSGSSKEKNSSSLSDGSQNTTNPSQSAGTTSSSSKPPTEAIYPEASGGYGHSGKPVSDTAVPSNNTGDATSASLSPDTGSHDMEAMFNDLKETLSTPPPTFGERVKEGLHVIQEATPNDQAAVGGDLVKNHKD